MWGLSKKRIGIELVMSIGIWLISLFIQVLTLYNIPVNLLGSSCQITGFPVAMCVYGRQGGFPFWGIHLINISFWFVVINLFWGWFKKAKN